MSYVVKLNRSDRTFVLKHTTRNVQVKHVGRRGPQGEQGEQGQAGIGIPTGGTAGQILTKDSTTDYDTSWQDAPEGGVTSVNNETGDVVLNQDDVLDGTIYKQYSATEKTKLAGIEANADVTDSANVDAAGATMNSDTTLVGNGYFLDEDDMASNSPSKVPSQQSVKAYTDNRLYEKSDRKYYPGLRAWNAALADRANNPVRAVLVGDSITQLFGTVLAQKLNSQYNSRADSSYSSAGTSFETWNTWTGTKETTHGLGGWGGTLSGTQEGTLIKTCDGFIVLYDVQQTGGADLEIYIDGVLQTTINTTDAGISGTTESGRVWVSNAFTYGSHTLRVARSGTGTVMLSGAFHTNGNRASGGQIINAGHSGWKVSNFLTTTGTFEAVENLNPALIYIFLGTNDYADGVTTFKTNLTTMVQTFKGNNPNASILLVAPYEALDRSGWTDFVQAIKDVAIAEETEFVDLYEAMGGLGTLADTYGLSDDGIHPNAKGAELMTSVITDALIVPAIHNRSPYLKADASIPGAVSYSSGNFGSAGFGQLFNYPIYVAYKDADDVGAEFWMLNGQLASLLSLPSYAMGWGDTTANPDTHIARSAAGELTIYGSSSASFGNIVTGRIRNRAGTPEANISAPVGAIAHDTTNGDLYVKESGTGNTGWVKLVKAIDNDDVEITNSTKGVILASPDASRWRITVNDDGSLQTTEI